MGAPVPWPSTKFLARSAGRLQHVCARGETRHLEDALLVPLLRVVKRWAWDHALRAVLGLDGACNLLPRMLAVHDSRVGGTR